MVEIYMHVKPSKASRLFEQLEKDHPSFKGKLKMRV